MFEFEKKKLFAHLWSSLDFLKGQKCYIAGGTITSLFCNREINDIDVYFKSEKAFIDFATNMWGDGWIISTTKKATLVKTSKNSELQMIHFRYFPTAADVFDTFDFTACMGAFDFETETFHLHPEFLHHNSQRILKFNKNTAFPLVSLLRVQKYREKVYTISKPEFLRIALACMNLKIETYEELKEHLGGMYGVNYDKLFKDKEGDVDLSEAIDVMADLSLDDEYFKLPEDNSIEMGDLDDFLDELIKTEIPYIEINEQIYRVYGDNQLRDSDAKPKNGVELDAREVLKHKKYYKCVHKKDGRYISHWDNKFEYKVGEKVTAKNQALYFVTSPTSSELKYKDHKDSVLIEVAFDFEDFIDLHGEVVKLKSCTMLREVENV